MVESRDLKINHLDGNGHPIVVFKKHTMEENTHVRHFFLTVRFYELQLTCCSRNHRV